MLNQPILISSNNCAYEIAVFNLIYTFYLEYNSFPQNYKIDISSNKSYFSQYFIERKSTHMHLDRLAHQNLFPTINLVTV